MARKKQPEPEKENSERWLLTYSDLITLLMVFFVVMFAISNVNAQKMQAVANSLSQVLTGKSPEILDTMGPSVIQGQSGVKVQGDTNAQGQGELETVRQQVAEYIKAQEVLTKGLSENIVILQQERGLVISLKDTLLFASGSAVLTPQARDIIYAVGKTLTAIPNYVRVEGHTDNLPIHTEQFPSNWELSVLRATNVSHVLIEQSGVDPERVSASGYGEYRPLVGNDTAHNRSINRRVDIVILKQKYDYFEPHQTETNNTASTDKTTSTTTTENTTTKQ
ncbi:MAG: flagellar motor protein MotB [Ignavibacteriales bacterium]